MKVFSGIMAAIGALLLVLLMVMRIVNSYSYDIAIGGHLKRAADANTVEIAEKELKTALTNMEARGYTEGYTSLFIKTPDEDVGFWYNNIKSAHEGLLKLPPNATELEKSNMLMKLRETLTDHSQNGTSITDPEGISIYPYNMAYFIFSLLAWFLLIVFSIWFGILV